MFKPGTYGQGAIPQGNNAQTKGWHSNLQPESLQALCFPTTYYSLELAQSIP